MTLRLRCKTKNGRYDLQDLCEDSVVGQLKSKISEATNIPSVSLVIKHGFPPQVVNFGDDNQKLSDFSFRSGDTLTVDEAVKELPAPTPSQDASPATLRTAAAVATAAASPLIPSGEDEDQMVRIVVPANNSCLFTSVNAALNGGTVNLASAPSTRQKVAEAIRKDENYSDAMLGRPKEDYLAWIQTEDAWGGAIELAVLSKLFQIQISAIDIQTCQEQRFGEGEGYCERIILIYDGTHYDLLAVDYGGGVKMTRFDVLDEISLAKALSLAKEAQTKRQFTDFASFKLLCKVCQTPLQGQAEANEHARKTGHINFEEYHS